MQTLALLNQKGGVGKTSVTHHLGGTLAAMGHRVLLVDFDPQSSLSQGLFGPIVALSFEPHETIAAICQGTEPAPEEVIKSTPFARLAILAGSESVADYNRADPSFEPDGPETYLRTFLEGVADDYDFCLIDCPPNLYLCSWAALTAADALIVPMQPEDYGAQGLASVNQSVAQVRAKTNPNLQLLGYLFTMVARKAIHAVFEEQTRATYGALVFAATVKHAAAYPEAIASHQPISSYRPKGAQAREFRSLAEEVLSRLSPQEVSPEYAEV